MQYDCKRCGACCRWPGTVRISRHEAESIADSLGLDFRDFTETYTELAEDRRSLTLVERPDGACTFLVGSKHCAINAAKPQQCRDFPNTWRFPGFERLCQAAASRTDLEQD